MSHCEFVVTGFGPFAGVEDNPTERLVHLLEDSLQRGGDAANQGVGRPLQAVPTPPPTPPCAAARPLVVLTALPQAIPAGLLHGLRTKVLRVAARSVQEWLEGELFPSLRHAAPQPVVMVRTRPALPGMPAHLPRVRAWRCAHTAKDVL